MVRWVYSLTHSLVVIGVGAEGSSENAHLTIQTRARRLLANQRGGLIPSLTRISAFGQKGRNIRWPRRALLINHNV